MLVINHSAVKKFHHRREDQPCHPADSCILPEDTNLLKIDTICTRLWYVSHKVQLEETV